MSVNAGAKGYARALFELAQERNMISQTAEETGALVELFADNKTLREALISSQVPSQKKIQVLDEVAALMGMNPLLQNYLHLLANKNRLPWFEQIQIHFQHLVDENKNVLRGTVTTAEKMSEDQVKDLEKAFSQKFGRTVALVSNEDSSLLGGLVVKIKDLTFDGSIKTSLVRLKNSLERQYL